MTAYGDCDPVLIVDDDRQVVDVVANYLQAQGWQTLAAYDGHAALGCIRERALSVVLLDLTLPGMDGMEVCRAARAISTVPIVLLTGRVEESDKVDGLGTGADDYVCKPFSPREVAARVMAQWRRSQGLVRSAATSGLRVDESTREVTWKGRVVDLTVTEMRLLRSLLRRPGIVLSRARLLDALGALDFSHGAERTIDSHVRNLRRKLACLGADAPNVQSVYGLGYRISTLG